jgi:hypothetical protein
MVDLVIPRDRRRPSTVAVVRSGCDLGFVWRASVLSAQELLRDDRDDSEHAGRKRAEEPEVGKPRVPVLALDEVDAVDVEVGDRSPRLQAPLRSAPRTCRRHRRRR